MARPRKKRGKGEGSIYERKDGRWCAALFDPTTQKRRYLYAPTREAVNEKLVAATAKRQQGVPLGDGRLRLGAFLAGWLAARESKVKPRTMESYRYLVSTHIAHECRDECDDGCERERDAIGHIALVRLSPNDVDQFLSRKLAAGLSPRTVGYLLGLLRHALRGAVKEGLVGRNVAELVDPVKGSRRRAHVEPLTLDQTRQLLDAIQGDRIEAFVVVAAYCGLRLGELLGLSWENVDLDAGTLRVERILQRRDARWLLEEPKSESSRREIDLAEPVVAALRAHRVRQMSERLRAGTEWQEWGLVFTSPVGSPIHFRNALRHFHKALDKAGLPQRRLHDLRHGCATLLIENGEDLKTVADQLGHSDPALTLRTYVNPNAKSRRKAAMRLADALQR